MNSSFFGVFGFFVQLRLSIPMERRFGVVPYHQITTGEFVWFPSNCSTPVSSGCCLVLCCGSDGDRLIDPGAKCHHDFSGSLQADETMVPNDAAFRRYQCKE